MKKLFSVLLILGVFVWGVALADPTPNLLIDYTSAVITTPAGTDLKIGTGASTADGDVYFLADGTTYQTVDGTTKDIKLASGTDLLFGGLTAVPTDVGGSNGIYTFGTKAFRAAQGVNDANDTHISFYKSDATDGSADVSADSGDDLGTIDFWGADGDTFALAAAITVQADTGTGDGDMPGRIVFLVSPDASETPAEALRIANNKLVTAAAGITVTSGNVTPTNGSFIASTGGKTLYLQEGDAASACMGTATLNAAADVTVTTSCATASSRIFLTRTSLDADTTGDFYVKTKGAGSFVLFSEANDTATVDWIIFNESP